MSEIQVRLPQHLSRRLADELRKVQACEPVVFALVSHATTAWGELVLVRELLVPPESAYLSPRGHGARWSGVFSIDLLNLAAKKQCGVFVFHKHGGDAARMSLDDMESAGQLLPKFQLVLPRRPHGSVVLADDSAGGLILMPGKTSPTDKFTLRTFHQGMVTWPQPDESPRERLGFMRQPLARRRLVRRILAQYRIAVVGQSGGGTHVTQQLLQLGLGEIIGIDDDRVDQGNRFAGVGVGEKDIQKGRSKVAAVRRNLARIFPSAKYTAVREPLPQAKALSAVRRADLIVGCVNNLHARADIQEVALRYLIPYVDIGLTITPEDDPGEEFPSIRAISGNVFTFTPGGPCLWCTDFLTDEKLADESKRRGRPYLKTPDNADALVVSFNGLLASQAVTEVLQLLTGFAPQDAVSAYKKYDGFTGALSPCAVKKNDNCPRCNLLLGAGDPIWNRLRAA